MGGIVVQIIKKSTLAIFICLTISNASCHPVWFGQPKVPLGIFASAYYNYKPEAPSGIFAIAADNQVTLFWNESPRATSYLVKKGPHGGPYELIATKSSLQYIDTGITSGTTYYYVVSASNDIGESLNSIEVSTSSTPVSRLSPLAPDDPTRNYIGMNTWFLTDWDGSHAFVDVMKHARIWMDPECHNPTNCDSLGWPIQDASTVIFAGTPSEFDGTYTLVFNGQADVAIMWANGSVSDKTYNELNNTTTAQVTIAITGNACALGFRNTRRTPESPINSGITNVRLYRPGYPADGSAVFTTPFLNALKKTSVTRMMEWTSTNTNITQHWSQRMTPNHARIHGPSFVGPGWTWDSTDLGIALEHQIQLCNTLMSDCWINIPMTADIEYICKIALALRYGTDGTEPYTSEQSHPVYPPLNPNLRIYIEYANEIWNSAQGFLSFWAIKDIVENLPPSHAVNIPEQNNVYMRMWRYPAWRISVISDIFRAVYGDTSMMNRVRPLLMTQQGNGQGTIHEALVWLENYAKSQETPREVRSYIYGAGGSGYYGDPIAEADRGNADIFFAEGMYPPTKHVKYMGIDSVSAMNYGLKHIAYEGGPSLDFYTIDQAATINNDTRMQDMIEKTHDAWTNQGGDLLVYYCLTGPQQWEFTNDINNTNTAKFNALAALLSRPRAAVTIGTALPGTIIATDYTDDDYLIHEGYGYTMTLDGQSCYAGYRSGNWIGFPGHSASAFTGTIVIRGKSYGSDAIVNIRVNGVTIGSVTVPHGDHLADSTPLTVQISAGLVVIRLEIVTGDLTLHSVTVN